MDFDLSPEHAAWQRLLREFCEAEVKPFAAEVDENNSLHWDSIRKMKDVGLLGLDVPEVYGGIEIDAIGVAIAMEELGRACGSTALSLAAHNGLGCSPIVRWGTQAQKDKYLPLLVSGNYLGALALTEPGAGSDLAGGVQTFAQDDGDAWVINGSKAWITNAGISPVITVLLRTDRDAGTSGFSMILVEPNTPGVSIGKPEKKMGLKGSPTVMIGFDNVRVPKDALLGTPGDGFRQTMEILDGGRIGIGALSIGLAQAAYEEAIRYASQRRAFGKPIIAHQAIQWMIADATVEIEAARLLVHQSAWLRANGRPFSKLAAMGKLKATEVAEKVCHDSIQIHGSYGYSREYPVERIYRDQRLMSIGEGTSEIQRLVIARRVMEEFS
ncbi:MAG: acyl-CoA dehydrogenase family protein [Anaerolineae bacterium]|nr:acyl-CoA dehydrogenase family protein [Anaerolineae bacterium]